MIIEFERELLDCIQQEKSWNEVCLEINQPMSIIAVALKKLKDSRQIIETAKNNNIYYKINDNQREDFEFIG
jgi:predicted transcriptional regulator